MTYKTNHENNKRAYSAYITYSNELEAAIAILCIDSLLIEGKIIRAFFGTTKYCNYFLNNEKCPNSDKCLFLHNYLNDNNIFIDNNDNNAFSYEEHLNLAKNILKASNFESKYILEKKYKTLKLEKNVFPSIDFIFLNEEEKEKYFTTGDIRYVKTIKTTQNDVSNNFVVPIKELMKSNTCNAPKKMFFGQNDYVNETKSNLNYINSKDKSECSISPNLIENKKYNTYPLSSIELHTIFRKSINHILVTKPFYSGLKNVNIEKLELEYFLKDLSKSNLDIYELLDGCLDPISHLL